MFFFHCSIDYHRKSENCAIQQSVFGKLPIQLLHSAVAWDVLTALMHPGGRQNLYHTMQNLTLYPFTHINNGLHVFTPSIFTSYRQNRAQYYCETRHYGVQCHRRWGRCGAIDIANINAIAVARVRVPSRTVLWSVQRKLNYLVSLWKIWIQF